MARKTAVKNQDRVVELLNEASQTRTERGLVYDNGPHGGSYKHHGHVMNALFPNGVEARTPMEMNRLMNLQMIVGKLVRYAGNFEAGGHDDSLNDLSVYAQMQRELDEIFAAGEE